MTVLPVRYVTERLTKGVLIRCASTSRTDVSLGRWGRDGYATVNWDIAVLFRDIDDKHARPGALNVRVVSVCWEYVYIYKERKLAHIK